MITLIIKNMVCRHCAAAVRRALEGLGVEVSSVEIGRAELAADSLSVELAGRIDEALRAEGFEVITNPEVALTEKIKEAVRRHVRNAQECRLNLSACIEEHLGQPYDSLSRTFSAVEGRTIEKYHIAQRVELVKELLGYGQLPLTEIAFRAGYSSVAHLSRQFKDVTGLTPTQYRASGTPRTDLSAL